MSQVFSKRSRVAIAVLLGGTGHTPALTCKLAVVPMLLRRWSGDETDTTMRGPVQHQATSQDCPTLSTPVAPSPRSRAEIVQGVPMPCRPLHGFAGRWLEAAPV